MVGVQGGSSARGTAEKLVELAGVTSGRIDFLCDHAGMMDSMQGLGEVIDDV